MTVGRLIFLLLEKESNGISIIIAFILNLRALDHHSSFCRSAAFFTLYWWVLLSSSSLLGSIIIAWSTASLADVYVHRFKCSFLTHGYD